MRIEKEKKKMDKKIKTSIMVALLLISVSMFAQSVRTSVSPKNLVGHWKLDDGTGTTAYDSSDCGSNGVLMDGPVWTSGKINGALSFDGVDDYVQVPDSNSLDLASSLTIAMWFKPAITITPENPWFYSLLMKWHGVGDQWRTGYGIQIKEEGRISFLRGHGSGECSGISGTAHTWNADTWYHVAITYDTSLPSGNGKIYVDGIPEAQDNETRPIAPNTLSLCINNDPFELWHPQVKFFPGMIDDVRIYSRTLSSDEIQSIVGIHDVAISDVRLRRNAVGQGCNVSADVRVTNQGKYPETTNVTLYAQPHEQMNETGLVGHWTFDEGSGTTAYDSSGNGNDGTLVNGPTRVSGKCGNALKFDGVDDEVQVPDSASLHFGSRNFTVAVWVRSSYTDRRQDLLAKEDNAFPYPGFKFEGFCASDTPANKMNFQINTLTGGCSAVSTSQWNDGRWHHIVGVREGNSAKIYFDGVIETTGNINGGGSTDCTNPLHLGGRPLAISNGTLDEVRIYNRSLSAAEIWTEYTRDGGGLVGYWRFDEGSGTTAYDSSGNGNDGTLVNGPAWSDGRICRALRFGTDDYVEIPDSASLNVNGQITLTAWIRMEGGVDQRFIVDKGDGGSGYWLWIRHEPYRHPSLRLNASDFMNGDPIPYNEWRYVAVTYNGSTVMFYEDGQPFFGGYRSGPIADCSEDLWIGNGLANWGQPPPFWNGFSGTIDDVRIYNRALSADEIQVEYQRMPVATQTVTLESDASTTIKLVWNTTGFASYQNYSIGAYAWPVMYEADTADNTFFGGLVEVAHVGDIAGLGEGGSWPDGKVDTQDLARVSAAFGSVRVNEPNDPKYGQYRHPYACSTCSHTPNADINDDDKVDIKDLARTSANFGWHR